MAKCNQSIPLPFKGLIASESEVLGFAASGYCCLSDVSLFSHRTFVRTERKLRKSRQSLQSARTVEVGCLCMSV